MNEDEARTKWCPMAIYIRFATAEERPSAHNHRVGSECIASDCMMWRWEKGTAIVDGGLQADVQLDIGYCGLAGKP